MKQGASARAGHKQYFVIFAAATGAVAMVAMALLMAAPWRNPEGTQGPVLVATGVPDFELRALERVFQVRPIPTYAAPAEPMNEEPSRLVTAPGEPGDVTEAAGPRTESLMPTYGWVSSFGMSSTLDGQPLPLGAIVTAYDPDGNLIGKVTVAREGEYGLMPLYQDDPATVADEGAEPGDQITFRVNGYEAVVTGPHQSVWSVNGAVAMLELAATTDGQALTARHGESQ